ncbi:hypothetical protein N9Q43_00125 [bacterium]|nr:hypothetical protein [bacterium]|tara:strand:+ start:101 stop:556 length:456 start_codon:yes stop_codon:yes gene_type:complete
MYNKNTMGVNKDKIFSLFPDTIEENNIDISKDISNESALMLGMYVKLIYNHEIFHQKLKKFYEQEKIPFDVEQTKESSSFVVFNRAWSYISKIDLNKEEDLDSVMSYKKDALLSTLNQGIEYFETLEQYERCAKLLKIKKFKENVEKDVDM